MGGTYTELVGGSIRLLRGTRPLANDWDMSSSVIPSAYILDGRYRLDGVLGEGGMGRVYLAEDLRLGRKVAVKVLSGRHGQDPALCERLFREAKAAARANHPAIITVFGYGTDAKTNVSYLVMERLEGQTVEERIEQSGPLSVADALKVGAQLADAIDAVHQVGVIHRDLKPSNVFLATRGMRVDDVKLLDFGVAKLVDMNTLTATGQIFGTLQYMAPEQLQDTKRVDELVDLYALGAVIYECLCGEPVFAHGNDAQVAAQVLFGTITPASQRRRDVPQALDALVMRCLARGKQDRPKSAREVRDALLSMQTR